MTEPVVLAALPFLDPGAEAYFEGQVTVRFASDPSPATLIEEGRGARAIITRGGGVIGAEVIDALAPDLLAITPMGSGVDMIDVDAATAAGVSVLHNPGVAPTPVVEHVLALIPALRKRIFEANASLRAGEGWQQRSRFFGRQVTGYTLGVLGFGHIGREVARRATLAFDMEVIVHDPFVSDADLGEVGARRAEGLEHLLRSSDVVTLHAPLNDATRHIIDRAALELMKPDAVLINAARGGLVDPEALHDVLTAGGIAAAALDVFEPEPPADDDPLFQLPNLVVTPHVAGVTSESLEALHVALVANLLTALRGERPPHLANPGSWPPANGERLGFPLAP